MGRTSASYRFAILGSRGYPSTYSGFETLVRELSPRLQAAGHDVEVYCRAQRTGRTRTDQVDGITRVWTAGLEGKATSTLSYGLTSTLDARRRRPDAALILNVANGYYLPLLRRAGVPTVVNVDGIEWERDKWSRLGKAVFRTGARATARWADHLVADSEAIREYWQRTFDRDSHFLPYGAPVLNEVASDRLAELGLKSGQFLLVVGRVVPENNLEVFLDALQRMGHSVPAVVVGSAVGRSTLQDRLSTTAAAHPSFSWLGHVHDQNLLTQLWGHCGAYWHGHSVGGTNPSLLQALGCGAPVLAVDTVYNREVLGGADQVCPPRADQVAVRLTALMADSAERQRLAAAGRATVLHRYQWDEVCSGYEELLCAAARR